MGIDSKIHDNAAKTKIAITLFSIMDIPSIGNTDNGTKRIRLGTRKLTINLTEGSFMCIFYLSKVDA